MTTLTKLQALFAPEHVPIPLLGLLAFQEEVGAENYSRALSLYVDDKSGLKHGWSSEPAFLDALFPFATANASGSFYALWKAPDAAGPDTWPVVVFGDEGGEWVVAQDLPALLAISAFDVEPVVDHEEVLFHEDSCDWSSPNIDQYKTWLAQSFAIQPTDDPNALVTEAQTVWQRRFEKWKGPFLTQSGEV